MAAPAEGQALPEGATAAIGHSEDAEAQAGLDLSQVDGKVEASSMNQINQIITKHPDETVAILRQWMYQES